MSPADKARDRIRRSALWAAYGDALGFISEGADAAGVRRRAGTPQIEKTVAWKRRVGGKFGLSVDLPAGCISDDTQLRLATSRSIRSGGEFDVEAFAKIELTVWPSYALGAGRGSQEAAAHLRRRDVTWATNFFSANRAEYLKGGGNGAAMRIQPHVWAYPLESKDPARLITTVVSNAVATHGHPRGILGAVFHARCLQHTLQTGEVPGPDEWNDLAAELRFVGSLARDDETLAELWLGQWERHSGKRFVDEVRAVADEVSDDLLLILPLDLSGGRESYEKAVKALEATRADQRGSGTKTAILAALLSKLYADDPNQAVLTAANTLNTDTDTIGTMAGAIVGASASNDPDGPIADRDYIAHEADRMWAISRGGKPAVFRYPSVVSWTAPKSALDSVCSEGKGPSVAGLGPAKPDDRKHESGGKSPAVWQWLELWYGQRVLAKRRPRPKALPSSQRVEPAPQYLDAPNPANGLVPPPPTPSSAPVQRTSREAEQVSFDQLVADGLGTRESALGEVRVRTGTQGEPREPASIHELTKRVIDSGFDAEVVGETLLELADRDDGIEASLAYVAIITKARMSRRDRQRSGR